MSIQSPALAAGYHTLHNTVHCTYSRRMVGDTMIFLVDNMYVCGLVDLDLFGKKYLIIIMKTVDNDR